MFRRFRNTMMRFMAGRYGGDMLNNALVGLYLLLWFISWFVKGAAGLVLNGVVTLLIILVFWRMLSRNIPRRQAENARFLQLWTALKDFIKRQFDRIRHIRRWRYRRCPYCKAHLRLPIRRGRRTVTCFRCHGQFRAFFL